MSPWRFLGGLATRGGRTASTGTVRAARTPRRAGAKAVAALAGIGALLALLAACGSSSPSGPVDTPDNPYNLDFTAFDSAMNAGLAANHLAGATVVVVHRDSGMVYLRGYGAFQKDRLFLLASASKILSVGVIMRLADQHVLDLDAPVGNYVGSRWGTEKASLTLAQMLSNSSGLVGLTTNPFYLPYICQYRPVGTLAACAQTIYQADDVADVIPPDTRFRYGGAQWQLAGGIAEAASGKSWAELIHETYVEPCGTTSLGYTNEFNTGAPRRYPSSFGGNPANLNQTENPSIEGGGYITAEDYGKILLMHLRGGVCGETRVLSDSAVARMQEDRIGEVYGGSTGNTVLQGYGLGWWIDRSHPGVVADIGLYGAAPWLDVQRGYGAMILIEGTGPIGASLWLQTKPILDGIIDAAHL
ncbi:MAG: beta-lactamase family protein [Gemmatimonadaceae bacterium]|nr:beta-lactamase family protein [Gemmatimonadaceae bacterium]